MISKRHHLLKAALLKAKSKRVESRIPWKYVLFSFVFVFSTLATVSHIHADDLANTEDSHEICEALHHSLVAQVAAAFVSVQTVDLITNQPICHHHQPVFQRAYFEPPARAPPLFS